MKRDKVFEAGMTVISGIGLFVMVMIALIKELVW